MTTPNVDDLKAQLRERGRAAGEVIGRAVHGRPAETDEDAYADELVEAFNQGVVEGIAAFWRRFN